MKTVVMLRHNRVPQITAQLPMAASEIVQETVEEIERTIKVGMAEPKHGMYYERGTRLHQASAPGEMPAMDTGHLANSIQTHIDANGQGLVYTDAEYAVYLEYGTGQRGAAWPLAGRPMEIGYTMTALGMAPRPFMTPAAERARKGFVDKFRRLEERLR